MNNDGTVKDYQKISDTEGDFTATLDDNDRFGRSMSSLANLNGDGVPELVVGAPNDDDGGDNRGAIYILNVCGTPIVPIPTMGEWGLIFLFLLLLTYGTALVTVRSLSTIAADHSKRFHIRRFPFDLQGYLRCWMLVVGFILLLFLIAIFGFDYALTPADPIGASLSSFVAAYWVYLMAND